MNRYSFFILCLFLGLLSASAAVPETASGTIIDGENGQPIVGAVVQALNKQGKATAFASSNADGVFKIKISDSIDSISKIRRCPIRFNYVNMLIDFYALYAYNSKRESQ